LNDGSGAEDRAEDLPDRTPFLPLARRKSDDEDVANSLPSPRRMFDRNARRNESFADFPTWVALHHAKRKLYAVLDPRAKGTEVKDGRGTDRDQDDIASLLGLHRSVDEAFPQQLPEERLRILFWDGNRAQRFNERPTRFHSFLRYTSRYLYEERPASARIMRAPALALALLVLAVVLTPPTTAEDWGAVGKVTKLMSVKASPELAPGDSGRFEFYLNSTYTEAMINVTLTASIYRYATIDESIAVDSSWPYAYPKIAETGTRAWSWTASRVDPGSRLMNFTVVTAADSHDMPHGSIFSQSSYFVRFSVDFEGNVSGTLTPFRLASRGFFTDAQWNLATSANSTNPCTPPSCRGNVNLTVLGVDGVLPDSAFGVKEPIPRWPFYLLIGLAALFLVLAFLFWVEENPGSYPRVEASWARTRGRLARTFAPIRRRRPPKA